MSECIFRDGDIICFLGDSITANGLICAEVYQTLGKQARVKCYNCGVSGGRAAYAKDYLYSYCLSFNPTHVAITFGINDIDRHYYSESYTEPDKNERIAAALDEHKRSYEQIVKGCLDFGAEVIICIPSPYDEVSDAQTENFRCQSGLDESAKFIRKLAVKYGCHIVDYDKVLRPMLGKPNLIRDDRVHPTEHGYHVMAQTFMLDTGIIEECDLDTQFEFEPWNKERWDAERPLKDIDYVEYCHIFRQSRDERLTTEDKKALALSLIDKTDHEGIKRWLAFYAKEIDYREKYVAEVVRKSIFIKEI